MNNKKLAFSLTGLATVVLLLVLFVSLGIHHRDTNQEAMRRVADASRNKRGVDEAELFKEVFASMHQEVVACDHLRLSKEEKARRVSAVAKAAQTEMLRVRATHYKATYRPPHTD